MNISSSQYAPFPFKFLLSTLLFPPAYMVVCLHKQMQNLRVKIWK